MVCSEVIIIQIIGLVISLALMVVFYVCMLRPHLSELTKCRRRVAYLLSTVSRFTLRVTMHDF
jgi:hypothetical protein